MVVVFAHSEDRMSDLLLKASYNTNGWNEEKPFRATQKDVDELASKINEVIDRWVDDVRRKSPEMVYKKIEVEVLVPIDDDLKGISQYFQDVESDRRSAEGLEEKV